LKPGQACSSLIEADENRLGESMLACLAFDVAARRLLADRQAIYRQRKEPEMIMVGAMAARRTWAAMAESPEINDGLLEACLFRLTRGTGGEGRPVGRNVIGCPMMPRSRRRIGITAQEDKLRIPAGASLHSRGGETSSPSQVKPCGMAERSEKAVELSGMTSPPW
jgi:hypothetical protein